MNTKTFAYFCALSVALLLTSCTTTKYGSTADHAKDGVFTVNTSYNDLTMELAPQRVSYTIDISTTEGRAKLKNISLEEAKQLALIECINKYNCATIFNPQFTHLVKGKDVLRVTVYGFPALYKNK